MYCSSTDRVCAAQLGYTVLSAQAFEHDPDLVFGRKMSPRCPVDILQDTLGRGLGLARVFWSHLRSFVTTMRPEHSLNHNIKSVPLVLTGNRYTLAQFSFAKLVYAGEISHQQLKKS